MKSGCSSWERRFSLALSGGSREQLDVEVWDEEAREPGSSSEGGLAPGPGGRGAWGSMWAGESEKAKSQGRWWTPRRGSTWLSVPGASAQLRQGVQSTESEKQGQPSHQKLSSNSCSHSPQRHDCSHRYSLSACFQVRKSGHGLDPFTPTSGSSSRQKGVPVLQVELRSGWIRETSELIGGYWAPGSWTQILGLLPVSAVQPKHVLILWHLVFHAFIWPTFIGSPLCCRYLSVSIRIDGRRAPIIFIPTHFSLIPEDFHWSQRTFSLKDWKRIIIDDKYLGFPGGASGKELACQYRRCKGHQSNPWVKKMPWRRAW